MTPEEREHPLAAERAEHEGFGASRHWGGYGSDHVERGISDRLADAVRAWLGDEDAARRREEDDIDTEDET